MGNFYRIIDANINRSCEGLRVLEDVARFTYNNQDLSKTIRELRHKVRKSVNDLGNNLVINRDSIEDVGLQTSANSKLDIKTNTEDLIIANFKRAQEALRVIEENLKPLGYEDLSKIYERLRFQVYTVEKRFIEIISSPKKNVLATDIYAITAEEHSLGRTNIEVVEELIKSGIKIIQYREKDKAKLDKYKECKVIRRLTNEAGVTFIVNDDIDIAILVGADGVHIGQEDLPLPEVRKMVGPEMIIGLSTHSPEQAQEAVKLGADYIGVGPIFATKTKKNVCDPVGFEYLDYVVKNINIPFVAIGGIKLNNIGQVSERGANCICLVTEIVGAQDIDAMIQKLRYEMI